MTVSVTSLAGSSGSSGVQLASAASGNVQGTSTALYTFRTRSYQYPPRFIHAAALRRFFIVRNTTPVTMQIAPSTLANDNANPPGGGAYFDVPPGSEYVDWYSKTQWFIRPKPVALTALTSSGTVATATLANHGLTTGSYVSIQGAAPSGYNTGDMSPVTVVNANTFTYVLDSAQAVVTTLPTMADVSRSVEIEFEVTL